MIDELPEDLAALIAAERAARPSPRVYASVRAKLAASAVVVGAAKLSSTSAAAAGSPVVAGAGLATKLVVVLAIAIGGTTAAVVATRDTAPSKPRPVASEPTAPKLSVSPIPTPPAVPLSNPPEPIAPAPTVPPSSHVREHVRRVEPAHDPAPPTKPASPPVLAPVSEAETVATAWRTLATDPAAALVDIETITGGTLVEEREAIRCVALARLHRAEAADAITSFLSAHPRSVHRALVERAQKGLP